MAISIMKNIGGADLIFFIFCLQLRILSKSKSADGIVARKVIDSTQLVHKHVL